ncbi:MAG: hypothetical protein J0H73_11870 [Salana multivorans]|uniref:hypothetical protein n=1 Tax=Salana multivorans TaxID=120377 RepID=UPI000966EC33|nr:hypothetical protein [Salana multivorans]MBN8882997.1 hypothetical protein [Salana multivorans]OJX94051.1 MAG: hypothetical protein BGO96_09600 [Micrococcales bacterium 73-15]
MPTPSIAQPTYVSVKEAARQSGLSRSRIFELMKRGDLVAHYPTSRPLLLLGDVLAHVEEAPTESPRRTR